MNSERLISNFLGRDGAPDVLDVFRRFIGVFELPEASAGTNWGVTLPVTSAGDLLRLNARNQQVLSATWNPDEWTCHLMVPDADYVRAQVDRRELDLSDGQHAQPYPDQIIISGPPHSISALLEDLAFVEAHREFVSEFTGGPLLKRNWSNAEVVDLVLGTKTDDVPSPLTSPSGGAGVPYRPAHTKAPTDAEIQVFYSLAAGQTSEAHARLQDDLANSIRAAQLDPRSPEAGDPQWDVAFRVDDRLFVVEVKSTTPENEVHQLRLGLGQVLEYRSRLSAGTRAVLYVEHQPRDPHWELTCEQAGVVLLHPGQVRDWLKSVKGTDVNVSANTSEVDREAGHRAGNP